MKFAVFTKIDKDVSDVEKIVVKECEKHFLTRDNDNPDVAFVLGGDGTFLRAIHSYIDKLDQILLVGIRCGTLGFFYDFGEEDISRVVEFIANNQYQITTHRLIECDLNDKVIYAANEIRFENPFHTLVCNIKIDGVDLEKFHGNGLLVCNELGSTAYNKSLGGAVISHDLDVLQLTEISTIQNNLVRSLGSSFIAGIDTVFTFEGNFKNVVLGYDHLTCDCGLAKTITVKASDKKARVIHEIGHTYIDNLKRSFIK